MSPVVVVKGIFSFHSFLLLSHIKRKLMYRPEFYINRPP